MSVRWQDTAKRLIDEMINRKYPMSVVNTARGAMLLNPEKTDEIDQKVRACQTPREVVKAMQMYYIE